MPLQHVPACLPRPRCLFLLPSQKPPPQRQAETLPACLPACQLLPSCVEGAKGSPEGRQAKGRQRCRGSDGECLFERNRTGTQAKWRCFHACKCVEREAPARQASPAQDDLPFIRDSGWEEGESFPLPKMAKALTQWDNKRSGPAVRGGRGRCWACPALLSQQEGKQRGLPLAAVCSWSRERCLHACLKPPHPV